MQDICAICANPTIEGSEHCTSHNRAFSQIESAFRKWQTAYGNGLDKRAFLERLLQLSETGQKAREVATFLLEKDSS